jgi:hypothetical protein
MRHAACGCNDARLQRCNAQPRSQPILQEYSLGGADAQTCTIHTACRPAPRLVHIRTCEYRRARTQSTHEYRRARTQSTHKYRRARTFPLHVRLGTLRHNPAHSRGLGRAGRAARCAVHSIAWLGLAWLGLAWLGLAWLGGHCRMGGTGPDHRTHHRLIQCDRAALERRNERADLNQSRRGSET